VATVFSNFRKLQPYLQTVWPTLSVGLVCTLGFVVSTPLVAWLAGQAATVIGQGQVQGTIWIAVLTAILFLARGVVQFGRDAAMSKAAFEVVFQLRQKIVRHLYNLDLSYFETAATGDLTYRLTEDCDRVGELVNRIFQQMIPSLLLVLTLLGYLLYLNWQLTLVTLLLAPLIAILTGWFGERLLKLAQSGQQKTADLATLMTEVLGGIRLVKALAAEEHEIQRFNQTARQSQHANYAAERIKAIQYPAVTFLQALAVVLLFVVATWQIAKGHLTRGALNRPHPAINRQLQRMATAAIVAGTSVGSICP
jgi:ATP-binding cassette, subfamily B, bacterial